MAEHDVREALEHQVDELRSQLKDISKALTGHGIDIDDIKDSADGALHGVARSARHAVKHAQHEASAVAETARENPTATTTALALVGGVGFVLGYALAVSTMGDRHRRWR